MAYSVASGPGGQSMAMGNRKDTATETMGQPPAPDAGPGIEAFAVKVSDNGGFAVEAIPKAPPAVKGRSGVSISIDKPQSYTFHSPDELCKWIGDTFGGGSSSPDDESAEPMPDDETAEGE